MLQARSQILCCSQAQDCEIECKDNGFWSFWNCGENQRRRKDKRKEEQIMRKTVLLIIFYWAGLSSQTAAMQPSTYVNMHVSCEQKQILMV